MNMHEVLVLLVVSLGIAAGAVLLYVEITSEAADRIDASGSVQPRLVNVIGENITAGEAATVRVAVTSDERVSLEDASIAISTSDGSAQYSIRVVDE